MSAPDLATQVAKAGNSPNDFNNRERKMLESVKTYVDAAAGDQNQLSELSDTEIATPASGDMLVYDGSDSWDNKAMSGDATLASTGALTIAADAITTAKIADLQVTTAKLAADAVDNTKLADDAVSLENLDSGIEFAFRAMFAGTFTTLGGDAAESITVTGATDTDIVVVTVKTAGAVPRSIVAAAAGTDTIAVTMSDDPSTDHVLQYVVFRAAS